MDNKYAKFIIETLADKVMELQDELHKKDAEIESLRDNNNRLIERYKEELVKNEGLEKAVKNFVYGGKLDV